MRSEDDGWLIRRQTRQVTIDGIVDASKLKVDLESDIGPVLTLGIASLGDQHALSWT